VPILNVVDIITMSLQLLSSVSTAVYSLFRQPEHRRAKCLFRESMMVLI